MAIEFVIANPKIHWETLVGLNTEYLSWVLPRFGMIVGSSVHELLGMSLAEYVPVSIEKICGDPPPMGIFYLLQVDGDFVGMGGLRRVRDGVAEIKRIYVKPELRGQRLGEQLLKRLLEDARQFNYLWVLLDSAQFMKSAQNLYESYGFVDRPPCPEVEAPQELHHVIRFMEKKIQL